MKVFVCDEVVGNNVYHYIVFRGKNYFIKEVCMPTLKNIIKVNKVIKGDTLFANCHYRLCDEFKTQKIEEECISLFNLRKFGVKPSKKIKIKGCKILVEGCYLIGLYFDTIEREYRVKVENIESGKKCLMFVGKFYLRGIDTPSVVSTNMSRDEEEMSVQLVKKNSSRLKEILYFIAKQDK